MIWIHFVGFLSEAVLFEILNEFLNPSMCVGEGLGC
jgi:hypothetical protein